jgi:hypothetical protein
VPLGLSRSIVMPWSKDHRIFATFGCRRLWAHPLLRSESPIEQQGWSKVAQNYVDMAGMLRAAVLIDYPDMMEIAA